MNIERLASATSRFLPRASGQQIDQILLVSGNNIGKLSKLLPKAAVLRALVNGG